MLHSHVSGSFSSITSAVYAVEAGDEVSRVCEISMGQDVMRVVKTYCMAAVPVAGKVDDASSVGHVGGSKVGV
jgi:hypothetical protein